MIGREAREVHNARAGVAADDEATRPYPARTAVYLGAAREDSGSVAAAAASLAGAAAVEAAAAALAAVGP